MDIATHAAAVRRFNRFYTHRIGVLPEKLLQSPFSLTEVRVLYELAQREQPAAAGIAKDLGLDAGYLSRILRGFETRGLVSRTPSETDARQSLLAFTPKGRKIFEALDKASTQEVSGMLFTLSNEQQNRLVGAMRTIEEILSPTPQPKVPYILRPHQPGDMGWVVQAHGVLYAREYGWNEEFEALVAEIVAKFIRQFDARRERCWIAEREGRNVGCVFLVRESDEEAKLRLLLVDAEARGLGIGKRLVDECIRFARQSGYRRLSLWTNDVLHAARHLYEQAGFRLVEEKRHHSFGRDLVGQTWMLDL
jgi:DNA-binding MarR family transcriptional regulator/N-acetylglutamate synthase-like GNAT family acetyltransferase